jgi:hypothetical protein
MIIASLPRPGPSGLGLGGLVLTELFQDRAQMMLVIPTRLTLVILPADSGFQDGFGFYQATTR